MECFERVYLRWSSHRLMTMVLRAGGPRRKVGTVQFSRSVNRPLSRNTCSARTRTALPPRAPPPSSRRVLSSPVRPSHPPFSRLPLSLSCRRRCRAPWAREERRRYDDPVCATRMQIHRVPEREARDEDRTSRYFYSVTVG